jgi:POT family proton-dependent oligopeptide transporter
MKDYFHGTLGTTLAQGYNAAFAVSGAAMLASLVIFLVLWRFYAHTDRRAAAKGAAAPGQVELTPAQERGRITALLIVFGIVIFFWMAFHQNGFTLTLFAENYTAQAVSRADFMLFDLPALLGIVAFLSGTIFALRRGTAVWARALAGAVALGGAGLAYAKYTTFADSNPITAELFQSFNPIFIVFLTPLIVSAFAWLSARGKEPSSPAKIGIGMLLTAIGFAVMVAASRGLASVDSLGGGRSPLLVTPYWLISTYFVLTFAELFLSPMGLSFVSKVAPPRLKGLMQGGWLGATAVGNLLAGFIGRFYKTWELYQFFLMLVVAALVSALLVLVVLKRLKAATS